MSFSRKLLIRKIGWGYLFCILRFGGIGVYAHINFLFNFLRIFTSFITDHTSLPQLLYVKPSCIFSFLDQQQLSLYTRHGVVKAICQGKENSAFRTTTEHSNDPVQFQWVECWPGKHQDKKESLKLTILPWWLSPNPLTFFYKITQECFHLRKLKWVFNDSQDFLEGFTAEISQYIIDLNYPQSSKYWIKKEMPCCFTFQARMALISLHIKTMVDSAKLQVNKPTCIETLRELGSTVENWGTIPPGRSKQLQSLNDWGDSVGKILTRDGFKDESPWATLSWSMARPAQGKPVRTPCMPSYCFIKIWATY